jgi:hypothetical protein
MRREANPPMQQSRTQYCVGNLAEIENRIEKDLGCTLSNLVEYNTYENGTLTLFHYEIHTIYRH